jgi:hypothetical protein
MPRLADGLIPNGRASPVAPIEKRSDSGKTPFSESVARSSKGIVCMVGRPRSVSLNLVIRVVLGCFLLGGGGCSKKLSPNQRVEKELSQIGKSAAAVLPFAGKVLVDGQPAQGTTPSQKIVVVLFDRTQPKLRVNERPHAECNDKGEFAFTTYSSADGVPPGEYVVAIAQLFVRSKDNSCEGPDGLKNLYNDPEKNDKIPEFTINHASPGKTDYVFGLKLAGEEPVSTPGPRTVSEILEH